MNEPTRQPPLYSERDTYRRSRLIDASRLVPLLLFVLWLLPLLGGYQAGRAGAGQGLGVIIYVFGTWIAGIAITFHLNRRIKRATPIDPMPQEAEHDA